MRSHIFLLKALLFTNVTFRVLTNYFNILPRHFNLLDIVFVVLIVALALASPKFNHHVEVDTKRVIRSRLLIFNVILVLGTLLNATYFYLPASLGQILLYNEPVLLFLALSSLPFTLNDIESFKKLLLALIIFEITLGLAQTPIYFMTGDSEAILGTFQHNAEQYSAFIMIGIYYLMGLLTFKKEQRLKFYFTILSMLFLILIIDNKASWFGIITSIAMIFVIQARIGKGDFRVFGTAFALVTFLVFGYVTVTSSSASLKKISGTYEAIKSNQFKNLGKIKAYEDILRAYSDHPHMTVFGSGPGTFYSRLAFQFYYMSDEELYSNAGSTRRKQTKYSASNSMGGVIRKTSKEPFFKQFFVDNKIFFIGSSQVDSPYSSYAAILGETGILGAFLYLSIYGIVLKYLFGLSRKYLEDSFILPMIFCAIGMSVYILTISVYSNWLETGRMTTILWSLISVVYIYDSIQSDKLKTSTA